jgi:hypothetical protein|tara:strand:- start:2074 stop:2727 length:654 start_codon:yes stop_codon:yes gene_type:complete
MGFLDNTSITVDAILTKKGRELLARGQNEFKITKFALADDEVDYNLYDTAHPNGSNFYAAVIENMPLLEAFVDENQLMRYKLTTLPKETNKLPILELPSPSLTFNGAGITQAVTPNTRNAPNETYTFTLFNADVANISLTGGGNVRKEQDFINAGATTPVFMNEAERKRSISVVGKSVRVISRSLTTLTNTNLSVTGNSSGAQFTVAISVKADPSKV